VQPFPELIDPQVVGLSALGLEEFRLEIAVDAAVILIRPGLGDDIDNAAL
jgi:hypothetical protein